jgi:hypothetical protein
MNALRASLAVLALSASIDAPRPRHPTEDLAPLVMVPSRRTRALERERIRDEAASLRHRRLIAAADALITKPTTDPLVVEGYRAERLARKQRSRAKGHGA